jgi:putative transposase
MGYQGKGRRSMRLPGSDYSQPGAYFVAICTQRRACLFGRVENDAMVLNETGAIVAEAWHDLPNHYPHIELDTFVVMPNHVHGIITITDVGAGFKPAPRAGYKPAPTKPAKRHGLPEIVRGFKTFSARRISQLRRTPGTRLWQRGYYEHVIRNEESLACIRAYIEANPLAWALDRETPMVDSAPPNSESGEDEPWRV